MRRLIVVPVGLIMAFWSFSMLRTTVHGTRDEGDTSSAESSTDENSPSISRAPAAAQTGVATVSSVAKSNIKQFQFTRELTTFSELKAKVFLTDEEKEVKRALLGHILLMRAVAKRLVEPSTSEELVQEQEAGVDLLLEAYKEGDRALAGEILRDVVSDRQVENTSLPDAVREQLAGVKAEILYLWSAMAPELAADIPGWLPGPVSQKIWDNVTRKQQANLAESEVERSGLSH